MPEYIVKWKYKSGLGGMWFPGDQVELSPALAAAINNDSPGVLDGPLHAAVDDLTAIAGIGEQTAKALRAGGVWSFEQFGMANPEELVQILLAAGQLVDVEAPAGDYTDDAAATAALHQARLAVVTFWQAQLAALLQARENRLHAATQRRDREGDPGDQGVMTRENFGAVKDKPSKGKGKGK